MIVFVIAYAAVGLLIASVVAQVLYFDMAIQKPVPKGEALLCLLASLLLWPLVLIGVLSILFMKLMLISINFIVSAFDEPEGN